MVGTAVLGRGLGLGFSTLLTLVLTPVMLGTPMRLGNWRRKMLSGTPLASRSETQPAE